MDYKEKYEQGLECLEEILSSGQEKIKMTLLKERLLPFFPELENEDDKIRKKCINFLNLHKRFHASSAEIDECIAWLEKQEGCKQKNKINSYKITFEDVLVLECAMKTIKITEGGNELYEKLAPLYNKIHNVYLLEKQGEQKIPINDFKAKNWYVSKVDGKIHDMTYNPTDKLEPKFKFGDWIVNNNSKDVFLIKSINSGYCTLESIKGNIISPCLPPCESESHIWTIQDAKDGDVLVYGDNPNDHHVKVIMIFKSWRNSESAFTYFHIYDNEVRVNDWCDCGRNTHPATKEQRDILFTKMKEAGYKLDVEKKAIIPISKSKVVEYVYILDYSIGRVMVVKHNTEESIEDLFKRLCLKESQCHYMVSDKILSIEYINF